MITHTVYPDIAGGLSKLLFELAMLFHRGLRNCHNIIIFQGGCQLVNSKKYYLGLDIGTDSVGYAACDEEYNLLKFHGDPAWGTTIFDAASLNAERRGFRSARRRLDRRQQRVFLLRELFAPEIAKTDDRFFIRLSEVKYFELDLLSVIYLLNHDKLFL